MTNHDPLQDLTETEAKLLWALVADAKKRAWDLMGKTTPLEFDQEAWGVIYSHLDSIQLKLQGEASVDFPQDRDS